MLHYPYVVEVFIAEEDPVVAFSLVCKTEVTVFFFLCPASTFSAISVARKISPATSHFPVNWSKYIGTHRLHPSS